MNPDALIPLLLIVEDAIIMGGLFVGAALVWRSNGPTANAFSRMLLAIGVEIGFAIASDQLLDHPQAFAIVKIIGRLAEGVGVGFFLVGMFRKQKAI